jgi:Ca2+-transporting ATPase
MPARVFPLARVAGLTPDRGLTASEVAARRAHYGRNDVVEPTRGAWWALAGATARDPMLWFLVGTSALYATIGEVVESTVLAAAIVPLTLMDAYLHRRTSASTEGLRSRLAARARVVRDGGEAEIAAGEVVPGDLVLVAAGDLVPADGVIVDGAEVQADESALTGESVPVRKRGLPWPPRPGRAPPVALEHWGYAGTRVLAGQARLRVAYTGAETLYGEIVRAAVASGSVRTPLQRAIADLVMILTGVAVAACVVLAAVRLWQGYGWLDASVSALTLAIAALPEEFPVVFTFFLGVGVYRLARRRALVRRAAAVENIGRITSICSDKTGTLTEGRLALVHLVAAAGIADAGLVALAAEASRPDSGDPVDVAIAAVAGVVPDPAVRVATFPFTEERKRETVVVRRGDGTLVAVTKGVLETVLALTAADGAARAYWMAQASELAGGGHKVIACAWSPLGATWDGDEPRAGFALAGLLAFEDPVRPGVSAAVQDCRAAGLRIIMVTGDHPLTACAVAREIGLGGTAPEVATGDEVAAWIADAADAAPALARVDVVARATPTQKLALVQALQRAGELVAVTGDGINDVPALRTADVGIAMGERGTQSAREVAPIVLLDDDFATIVGAIAEGRQLFHNLQQSFRYLLMMHIPLVVTAALVPLAGYPLLYLPIHIVWLELIIHPTAMLAFQAPARAAELAPLVRRARVRFFTGAEWLGVVFVGVASTTLVGGGFLAALDTSHDVAHARAVALVTLALASAGLVATLSGFRTRAARVIAGATVVFSLLLVQTPALAVRLHVTPLHANDLATAALAAVVVAALTELQARAGARPLEGVV